MSSRSTEKRGLPADDVPAPRVSADPRHSPDQGVPPVPVKAKLQYPPAEPADRRDPFDSSGEKIK